MGWWLIDAKDRGGKGEDAAFVISSWVVWESTQIYGVIGVFEEEEFVGEDDEIAMLVRHDISWV